MSKPVASNIFVVLVVIGALTVTPVALAQNAAFANVLEVHIQPGHQDHYESVIPKLWEAFKKAGVTHPISVSTSSEEPGTYTFVAPVASLADLGTLRDTVNKAFASVPQVGTEIQGMTTSTNQSVWALRPDLGYTPSSPRLKDSEIGFTRVVFLYVRPSEVPAFEAAVREGVAIRKKHGITDGTAVGQLAIGPDAPVYVILVSAKSEIDSLEQNAKNAEKMGAEWTAYLDKLGATERRIEIRGAVARPALAYQP